jgi:predicted nucleic acid-binding Zn ribbon protein
VCSRRGAHWPRVHTCELCKNPFPRTGKGHQKYCSSECRQTAVAMRERIRRRRSPTLQDQLVLIRVKLGAINDQDQAIE